MILYKKIKQEFVHQDIFKMTKGLIIALMLSVSIWAQGGKEVKAKELYEDYNFSNAIEKYEKIEDKSTDVLRRLAQAYTNLHNYEKSEYYFGLLMQQPDVTAEDIFQHAEALRCNQKYVDAELQMDKFYEMNPSDSRAQKYHASKGYVQKLMKVQDRYEIKNLPLNSEEQDFGVAFVTENEIVFASSREDASPMARKWNWNGLPFLDIYVCDLNAEGKEAKPQQFHKKINKKYHEGPAAFALNGKMMVFTRNNYKGKDENGVRKLQMFICTLDEEGKWSEEVDFPYNSNDYSVGHPAITPDGKTIYFASDMPGSFGGTDLYKVTRIDDTTWSDPVNLGAKINTEGNEMFPTLHQEGYLIFASNGHPSLGGLDNFIVKIQDGDQFSKVLNMGVPLNSSYDDFAAVLASDFKSGYFSSNRTGGKGSDDIYSYKLLKPFKFGKTIKGTALNPEGDKLEEVMVYLMDKDSNIVAEAKTSADGAYSFEVENEGDFYLKGTKSDYFDGSNAFKVGNEDEVIADVVLEKDPNMSLVCLITEKGNLNPITGVKITLTNNFEGSEEVIITDSTGSFMRRLLDKKLNDRISYNIKIEKEGYLTKVSTYNTALDHEGEYLVHKVIDLTLDKIEVGTDLAKIIDIQPIYFDLGKHNIRPDAAAELDKMVTVMNDNPEMVVELGSHSDCRGSKSSNQRLSDRRAKASAAYIKQRISNPDRIYGKGYGESKPVNHCECEGSRVVPCSEEEHQANRRTEFTIVKM